MTRARVRQALRQRFPFGLLVLSLASLVVAAAGWRLLLSRDGASRAVGPSPSPTLATDPSASPSASPTSLEPTVETAGPINTSFPGLSTFRGNATRSYYGEGPVPMHPTVLWRYPGSGGLCMQSTAFGETTTWCGTGWTGQPNVIEHEDGTIEVRIGAYDGRYHFLDGRTGEPLRPDLVTGDLAKGSATSDPDGYPLYYAGSRDNLLRVVALDRRKPKVLWSVNADTSVPGGGLWNNDWDGAPLVVDDHLMEGGENSWFYVIGLNRGYDEDGKVTVDPEIVVTEPGYDQELLAALPDGDVSIESSVAFHDGVAYFANSGGLVQGWDVSDVLSGGKDARRVFRFWTGDDTDATVVIDEEGFLYVASELQRFNARAEAVGQLMKLDPRDPERPLVWSVPVTERGGDGLGGLWSTPAVYGDMVYASTNYGDLLGVDRGSGKVRWQLHLPGPTWSSPVPMDGVLLQGDCGGVLHAYDISNERREPPELWSLPIDGGCIESTPAVWEGMIFVGTRSGGFYGIGDRGSA
ncbi:MAG TPA: PQQ-binding-like beta-propeller repeat protein [Actinomycetota bacterium]|nr:PQQ-binding-like beta-propeller repeat protein [Actinomycetota bacterium]